MPSELPDGYTLTDDTLMSDPVPGALSPDTPVTITSLEQWGIVWVPLADGLRRLGPQALLYVPLSQVTPETLATAASGAIDLSIP